MYRIKLYSDIEGIEATIIEGFNTWELVKAAFDAISNTKVYKTLERVYTGGHIEGYVPGPIGWVHVFDCEITEEVTT